MMVETNVSAIGMMITLVEAGGSVVVVLVEAQEVVAAVDGVGEAEALAAGLLAVAELAGIGNAWVR